MVVTWITVGHVAILNLVINEIPFFFGFNGDQISSLTLADSSVRCPVASFFREYIPRVLKRNIWAFYEIKTIIIMTMMMVNNRKIIRPIKGTYKLAGRMACLYHCYNYRHHHNHYQFSLLL